MMEYTTHTNKVQIFSFLRQWRQGSGAAEHACGSSELEALFVPALPDDKVLVIETLVAHLHGITNPGCIPLRCEPGY